MNEGGSYRLRAEQPQSRAHTMQRPDNDREANAVARLFTGMAARAMPGRLERALANGAEPSTNRLLASRSRARIAYAQRVQPGTAQAGRRTVRRAPGRGRGAALLRRRARPHDRPARCATRSRKPKRTSRISARASAHRSRAWRSPSPTTTRSPTATSGRPPSAPRRCHRRGGASDPRRRQVSKVFELQLGVASARRRSTRIATASRVRRYAQYHIAWSSSNATSRTRRSSTSAGAEIKELPAGFAREPPASAAG